MLKKFEITGKFDYYTSVSIITAKNEKAAIALYKRTFRCRQFISIRAI